MAEAKPIDEIGLPVVRLEDELDPQELQELGEDLAASAEDEARGNISTREEVFSLMSRKHSE
ncbi:hypothetical protein KAI87_11125 [Myxococcota bacterium]|nr:hypothetical protein [Myxococcota bacterium]